MAWGWAAAGQLGLGQCHQGSNTVLHPTPVSFSLSASSSSPFPFLPPLFLPPPPLFFNAYHVCFFLDFRSWGCINCPSCQAVVPLASGHRPQTSRYPYANLGEFVALTQYDLLAWTFLLSQSCLYLHHICTTIPCLGCIKSYL